MKLSLVLAFIGACTCALAAPQEKVADKEFLHKQKLVFDLCKYINHHVHFDDKSFDVKAYKTHFAKPEVFDKFWEMYHYEYFLPQGEIFSAFSYEHIKQVKVMFDLFYYAKDFETFYKLAEFARSWMNEGMFLYTFSVAVIHRADTYGLVLPPIYELYPHFFFSSDVIHQAQVYKQTYHEHPENQHFKVYANYSGHYMKMEPEQSMSYFHEDVGINTFYWYFNLYYPYWMSAKDYHFTNDKRGEMYYYMYQQILARYYMERLSNGYGEIEYFNWDLPFETPFYPSMEYPSGYEFPSRPKSVNLYEYFYNYGKTWTTKSRYAYSHKYVTEYEERIHAAIDFGYAFDKTGQKIDLYSEEGFNVLGNLIQGNPDSPHPNYYGSLQFFARHLLGNAVQPYNQFTHWPSALEHFETSMRDPAFYQLYKKIVGYFFRYKFHLKSYTKEQLYYPGVSVEKVEFDRLITFFDYFKADISSAVAVTDEEFQKDKFKVSVSQERLNHKPFTYKFWVKSDKPQKAFVKVFMGPKYDHRGVFMNITQNSFNFMEFDHFVYELKAGENVIERHSQENKFFAPDYEHFSEMYKKVEAAYKGEGQFHIHGHQNYFYFPQRFMLPKGHERGMPYQFFVFVYPFEEYKGHHEPLGEYGYPKIGSGAMYMDNHPLGYPFDRFITYEKLWEHMPNGYFYEAKVYHKTLQEVQGTH